MKTVADHPYVARVKGVCGGEPVIHGTRVAVRIIAQNWRAGLSPEEIQADYPHLTLAQVFDGLEKSFRSQILRVLPVIQLAENKAVQL